MSLIIRKLVSSYLGVGEHQIQLPGPYPKGKGIGFVGAYCPKPLIHGYEKWINLHIYSPKESWRVIKRQGEKWSWEDVFKSITKDDLFLLIERGSLGKEIARDYKLFYLYKKDNLFKGHILDSGW